MYAFNLFQNNNKTTPSTSENDKSLNQNIDKEISFIKKPVVLKDKQKSQLTKALRDRTDSGHGYCFYCI